MNDDRVEEMTMWLIDEMRGREFTNSLNPII